MTTLYITPKAWHQIERAVRKNPFVETGGILMGYAINENDWLITYASEPGPKAIQAPLSVRFDDQYLRNLAKRLSRRGRWKYIGDWHSHTVRRLTPSRADRNTVWEKATSAKYTSSSPIMLIAGLGKRNQVQARGFILIGSLREVQQIVLAERPSRRRHGGKAP
ncbi:Mov34/MPN/PAD-1 family protein [Brevibacillus sp. H7]|uniref:Mov34/MPN/PAD-1 family protein n=1 Tax=Brevibacillus sp. H7 TaxID=3349138 RepID=UPI0037F10E5B